MMGTPPQETDTQMAFQLPPDARVVRRASQDLGLQITVHEGHAVFLQNYALGERFGAGGFGHVHLARRIPDNRVVVVKEIRSDRIPCWCQLDEKLMPIEVVLLALCQNLPGIVRLLDVYNLGQSWVLVMDRLSDSTCDMFDYIGERGTLPEPETAHYFHQLIGILLACHKVGVLHRDIKDENLLINRTTNEIVLIDFGSGAFLEPRRYTDFDGTRVYCPPEWILTSSYDGKQAEVWSLGVLLYDMLCGDIPFVNDKGITSGKLRYRKDNLSKAAKDLIGSCLNMDPNKRPALTDILKHPWMAHHRPKWHDKQPPALLTALHAVEQISDIKPPSFNEMASASMQLSKLASALSARSQSTTVFCSQHSSFSSISPTSLNNGLVNECSQRFTPAVVSSDTRPEATVPVVKSQSDSMDQEAPSYYCNSSIRCSTGPPGTPRATFPVPVSTSSPNGSYFLWSGGANPQLASSSSPVLQKVFGTPNVSRTDSRNTVPVSDSSSRLNSNESGSSSGYYSRSDSLSSTEGCQMMTTTLVNASRTCSTSSYANSIMSISNVIMAHKTSCTIAHPSSRPSRDAALYAQSWRSGNTGISSSSSSSSSPSSSKSTSPDGHSFWSIPLTSLFKSEKQDYPMFPITDGNVVVSWSPALPCRKNNSTVFCSNPSATTGTSTTNSMTSSSPMMSVNSLSHPTLSVLNDEVGKLYQAFGPSANSKMLPSNGNAWFLAGNDSHA